SGCSKACSAGAPSANAKASIAATSMFLRIMAGSIAAFAGLATHSFLRLMEVAGAQDDALSARMARMPARMATLTHALAGIFSSGMLDVIAMGDGKRKLV